MEGLLAGVATTKSGDLYIASYRGSYSDHGDAQCLRAGGIDECLFVPFELRRPLQLPCC
ncbi:hypothetical protein FIBSPDRAFT_871798 [Athelia psychrophila]|uniref:Uncharacterized protein n=1 Tax=Athelia psychrophila TaxID=1759441 RepID=A0A166A1E6_9AGAM|nr:hypothetical protein FIBSPDRAFT_871798 [Fibularhizoctonia sp. CBS 109695]